MAKFPSAEWLSSLEIKLNNDSRYAQIAHNWEGDMKIIIEPGGPVNERLFYYIDLWHGQCRGVKVLQPDEEQQAAFTLSGPYENFVRIMKGEMDPLQAMLTRKVSLQGNMVTMMRSVPTVLDFVRCCRENTDSFL